MTNAERQREHRKRRHEARDQKLIARVKSQSDLPVARNWVLWFERTLEKVRAEECREHDETFGTSFSTPLVARRAAVLLASLPQPLSSDYYPFDEGD